MTAKMWRNLRNIVRRKWNKPTVVKQKYHSVLSSQLLPSHHQHDCISFSKCGMLYIGNTGRLLKTRFDIQASAVIGNDANQHVARYVRLIVAITMFQTRKLEPSVPFLVVMIATKKTRNAPHFQTWHCPSIWY